MSQAKQAIRLLRWMLNLLEPENLVPDEQKTLRRMIERIHELREPFEKILDPAHVIPHRHINGRVCLDRYIQGWPTLYTIAEFEETLDMERVRLLQAIVGSASIAGGIAPKRRAALRELPALLDQFGSQAQALAATLGSINDMALHGNLTLPNWFSHDPIALMKAASTVSGPRSYDMIAHPHLKALMARFSSHIPDIQAMLNALATVNKQHMQETEVSMFEFKRQANPIGDYARTLLDELAIYWHSALFLNPFSFTATELLQLASVAMDIDPDDVPDQAERRMREILRERDELDP